MIKLLDYSVYYNIGQCRLQFESQPPSNVLRCCNPYDQDGNVHAILQCAVRRQSGVSDHDQFIIKWFSENTTGAVEDLGLGKPADLGSMSQLSDYQILNQPYNPGILHVGKYWCQVIKKADPDQPLMRSNVFTLLAPGNYSGAPCSSIPGWNYQSVKNITCADCNSDLTTVATSIAIGITSNKETQNNCLTTRGNS